MSFAQDLHARNSRKPISAEDRYSYSIARLRSEHSAAFHLIYDRYVKKGLIEENPHEMRVTPYNLLPTTNVFLASLHGKPICTVSLIGDGELGLPMESIYSEEVEAARDRGLYVGEVSGLAVLDIEFRSFLPLFVKLTRLMAQFARANGMHQFLIATHPKHARFYQRFMGFEQIGDIKSYPLVSNAPAIACCLDFAKIDHHRPSSYDKFFGTPIPPEELDSQPMSYVDEEHFSRAVTDGQCIPLML